MPPLRGQLHLSQQLNADPLMVCPLARNGGHFDLRQAGARQVTGQVRQVKEAAKAGSRVEKQMTQPRWLGLG